MNRSFATLLIVLLLAVGAWQLAVVTGEQWALRRELVRLQREVGVLEIRDPSLIHVVSIPTDEPLRWRWRVYEPADAKTRWTVQSGRYSIDGLGESSGSSSSSNLGGPEPREYLVDVAIVVKDGLATFVKLSPNSSFLMGLSDYPGMIGFAKLDSFEVEVAGADGTQVVKPQEALRLLRIKGREPDAASPKDNQPVYPGIEFVVENQDALPVTGDPLGNDGVR